MIRIFVVILFSMFLTCCGINKGEADLLEIVDDESDTISNCIIKNGKVTADLNQDGKDDSVKMSYMELEGSKYISKFEIIIAGDSNKYLIENYIATFEKIELFDVNQDGMHEVFLVFDSRGAGGEGTRDIYIFDFKKLEKVSSSLEPEIKIENGNYLDDIYSIEKVTYNMGERLLVRQYMYGENGHVDSKGDVVSIVLFDSGKKKFIAEKSWIEERK